MLGSRPFLFHAGYYESGALINRAELKEYLFDVGCLLFVVSFIV
jgi:hypothetical protein